MAIKAVGMAVLQGLTVYAGLAAAMPAANAAPADPVYGLVLSTTWCSACHVVHPVQIRAAADAPSFFSIAETRSDEWLRIYLANPHSPMPTQGMSRSEMADIISYIRSLAR